MLKLRFSRPSPAGVISVIALFIALGGTGYAASAITSVTPKKKKSSAVTKAYVKKTSKKIADQEIAKHAINPLTLTVNRANFATTAGTATNAGHATTADNATHATNADNAAHAVKADSATHADAAGTVDNIKTWTVKLNNGQRQTVADFGGPFKVDAFCDATDDNGNTLTGYELINKSTGGEANSYVRGDDGLASTLSGSTVSESSTFAPGDGMVFNNNYNDREDNAEAASPSGWVIWAEGNLVVTKSGLQPNGGSSHTTWPSSPTDCFMSGHAYLQGKGA